MSDWWNLETMKNTFSGEIAIFGIFDTRGRSPGRHGPSTKPASTPSVPDNGDLRKINNESFVSDAALP
jgi:hypothetical protein